MRIIGDSWLNEPRAKILGMRARASRAVRPHKVGAYMPVWQLLIIFGGPYPVVLWQWGVAPLPRYFQHEKIVYKSSSHKFRSRRIYPECILVEDFY